VGSTMRRSILLSASRRRFESTRGNCGPRAGESGEGSRGAGGPTIPRRLMRGPALRYHRTTQNGGVAGAGRTQSVTNEATHPRKNARALTCMGVPNSAGRQILAAVGKAYGLAVGKSFPGQREQHDDGRPSAEDPENRLKIEEVHPKIDEKQHTPKERDPRGVQRENRITGGNSDRKADSDQLSSKNAAYSDSRWDDIGNADQSVTVVGVSTGATARVQKGDNQNPRGNSCRNRDPNRENAFRHAANGPRRGGARV
jgi:hypothetical protein